jgi:hypothetical protein
MKTKLSILLAVLVVVAVFGYSEHRRSATRHIKVFLSQLDPFRILGSLAAGVAPGMVPESLLPAKAEWADDFWASCGHMTLMTTEKEADYTMLVEWRQNRWVGTVHRRDSALVYRGEDPNYKQILGAGCRAIEGDFTDWVPAAGEIRSGIHNQGVVPPYPSDRFDLREIHNGSLTSTALLDKSTGAVWVWTALTDSNGKDTGKSAFVFSTFAPGGVAGASSPSAGPRTQ